jgi:hypothetical protein
MGSKADMVFPCLSRLLCLALALPAWRPVSDVTKDWQQTNTVRLMEYGEDKDVELSSKTPI